MLHDIQTRDRALGDLRVEREALGRLLAEVEEHLGDLRDSVATLDSEETDEAKLAATLAAARLSLDRLTTDLLGGPVRTWLKRQANPTEEQLTTLRERAREFADSMAMGGARYAGDVLPDFLVGLGVMILALYYFLADGRSMLMVGDWWLTVFPGVGILLVVLATQLLGDWLRVRLDPQLRNM